MNIGLLLIILLLNKSSKPQSYPIPRLSDVFDAIGEANAQYFTLLDLGKAFWQVPLSEESKEKTAFITHDGIFTWETMPFGYFWKYLNVSESHDEGFERYILEVCSLLY